MWSNVFSQKIIIFIIILFTIICYPISSDARTVKVYINQQSVNLSIPPLEKNGNIFLPLKEVITSFNGELEWDSPSQNIIIHSNKKEIKVRIGFKQAMVDGLWVFLDMPLLRVDGVIFAPLEFFDKTLGAKISREKGSMEICIEYKIGEGKKPDTFPIVKIPSGPVIKKVFPDENGVVQDNVSVIYIVFDVERGTVVDGETVFFTFSRKFISKKYLLISDNMILYKLTEKLSVGEHSVLINGLDKSGNKFNKNWKFWVVKGVNNN